MSFRARRFSLASLLLLLLFHTPARATPAGPARPAGKLDIWFVDVGQGLGTVIRTPAGRFVVFDCGPNDASGRTMADLLESLGATEISTFVLSHPHADHVGGFRPIFARFRVREVLDAGVPYTTRTYRDFLQAVSDENSDYRIPTVGDTLAWDTALTVEVANCGPIDERKTNNVSITLRIAHGERSFLLTGDAEFQAESRMVARFGDSLAADVLQAGHHGSRTSSSTLWLSHVRPRDVVISCGVGNSYGHPHPQAIERLEAAGARIWRTDTQGTIHVESDGEGIEITPEFPEGRPNASGGDTSARN